MLYFVLFFSLISTLYGSINSFKSKFKFPGFKHNTLESKQSTTTFIPDDLIKFSHQTKFVAECEMPTEYGIFKMRSYSYNSTLQYLEPIVLMKGDLKGKENILVRVHDQCLTSEVFGSKRCDCSQQLQKSFELIKENGGMIIYLQQEGRGIGIANKVAAYSLQDKGLDTVEANIHLGFQDEMREYHCIPDILNDVGVSSINLLTNNPYKIDQLTKLGVKINRRIPIQIQSNPFNSKYLLSKKVKMNHFLKDNLILPELDIIEPQSPDESHFIKSCQSLQHEISGGAEVSNNLQYIFGKQSVESAIEDIKMGKVVIVVDDDNRENEGDFILSAEKANPDSIGFIIRYSSGVLCVSMEKNRLEELNLPPMVLHNQDPKKTAYSISVDYKYNTSTGISAHDRALTFNKLVDNLAHKEDFHRPGHVFPLYYTSGGVLKRRGHTEASMDLTKLAGLNPGGVLAEIVHDDGSMMRLPGLIELSKKFNLTLTSVQDIVAYRLENNIQFDN